VAYSYQQILEAQYERIADEHARAAAELEAARVAEDPYSVTSAADRILELDKSREALDRRAQGFVASQQARSQGNRYGLSRDEVDIAHSIGSGDQNLTNDERERTYAHNRDKLRHLRSIGAYRDQVG
jgi:hypothetical protein